MTKKSMSELPFEPERYELYAGPAHHFGLARRDFFKVFGAGLVVVLALDDAGAQQESGGGRRRPSGDAQPQELGAWLHIAEDGAITVFTGKAEMGQNIRTSLSQVVAEELQVSPSSIRLVMADTDLTPFDMGTFGSRTTPTMAPQLRKVAAAARELLLDLAAERWKVDRSALRIDSGKLVYSAGNLALSYGQLTGGQKLTKAISSGLPVAPPDQWKIAGRSISKIEGRSMVTGRHRYTSDLKRPGMLTGKVLRAPSQSSTLASIETSQAQAMEGVTLIRDGDFVAVAASDEAEASRALASIRATWNTPARPSSSEIFEYLKANTSLERGTMGGGRPVRGSIEEGMAAADKKLNVTYTVAYIAHAPLEPHAAVAEWNDGRLTVWTGTQRPFGVRSELSEIFRMSENLVRVIVPDTGSAYGGKHTGEAAVEAARIAKAAGKAVKLVWTREEEFNWAYFRPAGVIEVKSGVRNDGTITAWEFHNFNSGASAISPLYDIPNQKIEFHPARSPFRQGSYRALAATANHFARESHIDELAHAVGIDSLEFRLKNLKDERFRAVLHACAERFGWGKSKAPKGRGFGIAGGFEKGGYVATCAEVAAAQGNGEVKLIRVVAAFECGAILNPDHLKNQVEGAIIQGIGGALLEAIEFENGKILNGRFSQYRVPRFRDVPVIDVVLLDRKDLPSAGAGETPIVGLAPAVGNAIFDAIGVRLRSLPMRLPNS